MITQSTINIYADSALTTLVTSVTTSGSDTDIEVPNLSAGTAYWATATATADGLTSEESAPYKFFTLPQIEFTGTMHTGPDWFSSLLLHTTTDVGISKWGICWDTSSSFTDPTYNLVKPMPSQEVKIDGLDEATTYYARACVLDIFGRTWVNPNTVTVATGSTVPQISWYGMSAVGQTTFSGSISTSSDIPLTSVVAVYTPEGGTATTVNLSAVTGIQSVSLTGLTPNTKYSVVCTATNAQGSASTSAASFTTNPADVTIECGVGAVDNATNIISADSKVHYDSSVVTLTGHYIDLYSNPDHEGTPEEEVSGGGVTPISLNLGHADPDETYFVFSHATYTIGEDPTEHEVWSDPVEVLTYSLFSFTSAVAQDTTAEVRYAVAGSYAGLECEISTDQINWSPVSMNDNLRNGSTIIGLTQETTYYLRGRCKSAAGWSGYDTISFTTGNGASTADYVEITAITNMTQTTAIFNVKIS